ncbi:hypothetical protein OG920_13590 [Streptomyces europaeiscabiei]|uniref:hypothetical protein n=1 Tax=Streptomyces TaxID=1883 RepID=UPI000A397B48|nr:MULTISPECIES: hypothetical protein [Streptomyces]MDX3580300.1 hypothetical protein [Streptomyces europaeiscabiei]MDX3613808.1 hypothetical protein [Streptomyces europaeiscabiei]MDX3631236.1 hypothetical protein [Streptomyces europaeiscabiei]MDX3647716.1 hypothetical protein [Streptomyces europaeiscabiei]WUD32398.1 hypothetical protein OG858_13790 [Streptomyces europaeiscabiei]
MTDDMTRGDGFRERGARETRDADPRREGVKGNGISPGTRATDPTGSGGTGAPLVAGHDDTTAGRTAGRTEGRTGRTMGVADEPGRGRGEDHTKASAPGGSDSAGSPLLPHDECDKLTSRLHHAVGEFVDEPRSAVEEADHVLEEVTARFTDAMTQRRRTLRTSWQTTADDRASTTDTEQLRLALRDYRELTERLLRI